MKLSKGLCAVLLSIFVGSLLCVSAAAQTEIAKAQFTTSFSYLNTARNSINQRGFEMSGGYNLLKWLTVGGDFCQYSGAGHQWTALPPGLGVSSVAIPFDATTYTMAVGTKFLLRRNKWVVPYVRPGLGLVHETATPKMPAGMPSSFQALLPPSKGEWRMFYGAGGGVEIHHVVPHMAVIVVSDYLRARLFAQDTNSYRISAGLSYLFGSKTVR